MKGRELEYDEEETQEQAMGVRRATKIGGAWKKNLAWAVLPCPAMLFVAGVVLALAAVVLVGIVATRSLRTFVRSLWPH